MARTKGVSKCRQSVTFTQEQHEALLELAEFNNVSLCWVVRYACTKLIDESAKKKKLISIPSDADKEELADVR